MERIQLTVQDSANKRGDQGDTSLSAGNSLTKAKEQGKITMDIILLFQFSCCLDTFPSRGNLDQDSVFVDPKGLVELDEVFGFLLGRLLIKRKARIHFG